MKRISFIQPLAATLLALTLTSCPDDAVVIQPYLDLSPSSIQLNTNGEGGEPIVIESNVDWSVESNAVWINLSKTSGNDDDTLTITAKPNPWETERIASVTVTSGELKKSITVYQGYDFIAVTPTELTFEYMSNEPKEISIKASHEWNITGVPEWLELSAVNGNGDSTVTVTAKDNFDEVVRKATLTITVGEKKETVKVTQKYDELVVTPESIELNYSKNSTATFNIITGKQWSISDVPSWLKLSAQNGIGNSEVTVTALTNNIDSQPLSAILTVEAGYQQVILEVNQRGSMSVTLSDYIVLSNGYWCQYTFGSGVSGYADVVCKAEYFDENEQAVQQYLEESETYTVASRTDFTVYDLPSQTTLVHCIAPYTLKNGVKKWGRMLTRRFTTPASTAISGVNISAISRRYDSSYGYYWSFNITSTPYRYYILAYENSYATENRTAPDILFAKFMFQNPSSSLSSMTGDLIYKCALSDYALLLVAWGGSLYGNITKRLGISSSYAPEPSQSPKATSPAIHQYYKTNTEDIKRWEETFKSCRIVTMPNNVLTR